MGDEKKNTQAEVSAEGKQTAQNQPAAEDSVLNAAAAERDRIKAILELGCSQELSTRAIDQGWDLQKAAVEANKELQAKIAELQKGREEDASVLGELKQAPASEEGPAEEKTNEFGVSFKDIDKELEKIEQKQKEV